MKANFEVSEIAEIKWKKRPEEVRGQGVVSVAQVGVRLSECRGGGKIETAGGR